MEVARRRLTMIAPVDLSTSYLIGCPSVGISMTTLKSSGGFSPGLIWLKSMIDRTCEVMAVIIAVPGLRRAGFGSEQRLLAAECRKAEIMERHAGAANRALRVDLSRGSLAFRIRSSPSKAGHEHEDTDRRDRRQIAFCSPGRIFKRRRPDDRGLAGACVRAARRCRCVAACRRAAGGRRMDHRPPARRRSAGRHGER